jgi:hypothetical protein
MTIQEVAAVIPAALFGCQYDTADVCHPQRRGFRYRYALSTPIMISFGLMLNCPAVPGRIDDDDGSAG